VDARRSARRTDTRRAPRPRYASGLNEFIERTTPICAYGVNGVIASNEFSCSGHAHGVNGS